jgi:hypothetical protein
MFGYSAKKIRQKADKRGISEEAYVAYLKMKKAGFKKPGIDRAISKSA